MNIINLKIIQEISCTVWNLNSIFFLLFPQMVLLYPRLPGITGKLKNNDRGYYINKVLNININITITTWRHIRYFEISLDLELERSRIFLPLMCKILMKHLGTFLPVYDLTIQIYTSKYTLLYTVMSIMTSLIHVI